MPNTASDQRATLNQESVSVHGDARDTMVHNIRRILRERGWSEAYLAKRANCKARSINNFMTPGSTVSPRVRLAEQVARGLGVPLWALFVPQVPDDPRALRHAEKILTTYLRLPDEGRDMIRRAAELEDRYSR